MIATEPGDRAPSPTPPRAQHHALFGPLRVRLAAITPQAWVLLLVTAVFVEFTVALCYLRYLAHYTNAWDLGIFQQSLWTTAHDGRLLYYTAELPWNHSGSFLGVNFSPVLFLLVPLYAAWPDPLVLFIVQAVLVAASAYPLYRLLLRRVSPWIATLLVSIYLFSPPILGALLYDFHAEAFVPLFALTLWWAWEDHRYALATIAGALLLSTLEYGPILLGAIAFRFALERIWSTRHDVDRFTKRWLERFIEPLGLAVAALPLTLIWFGLPKLFSPGTPGISSIGPLGGSVTSILWNLLTRPGLVGQAVSTLFVRKLRWLFAQWVNGLLLWPLAPLDLLPALPWFFVVFFTASSGYSGVVGYQYAFLTIPFLFVATGGGLARIRRNLDRRIPSTSNRSPEDVTASTLPPPPVTRRLVRWRLPVEQIRSRPTVTAALGFAAIAVLAQGLYTPFYPWTHAWVEGGQLRVPVPHDRVIDNLLGLIPAQASVSAQPEIFPQVANRIDSYPYYHQGTEFLIVDISNFWYYSPLPPPDPPLTWKNNLQTNVSILYGLIGSVDGVLVFQLGYSGLPEVYAPYSATALPSGFTRENASLVRDASAPLGSYIDPWGNRTSGLIWSGPFSIIPPGQYVLTTWLEAATPGQGAIELNASIDDGETVISSWVIEGQKLPAGWTTFTQTITIPHSGFLDVSARGVGQTMGIRFGGFQFQQVETPVSLG
ncbi:MAG: DUF2079 domain-containing protein [Thermoplasmata archaeon]|nr:DUF2079 domain-containing protein [Thermoplasmata archaeon]